MKRTTLEKEEELKLGPLNEVLNKHERLHSSFDVFVKSGNLKSNQFLSPNKKLVNRLFVYTCLTIIAIACILPFFMMLINMTRTNQEINAGISIIPGQSFWQNLENLLWGKLDPATGTRGEALNIPLGFLNSFIIATSATFLSGYFGALTAFGFFMYTFRGKRFLWSIVMAMMMIPSTISLIGIYQLANTLNMINTFWPLILPSIANAFCVFFLRQYFFNSLPQSVIEAARIDGVNELAIFHHIAVPMSMPGIATLSIFSFINSWNAYLIPLVMLNDKGVQTMPILIQQLNTSIYSRDFGLMYAGIGLSVIPILIIFALFSRYLVEGLNTGSVKE